MKTPHEELEHDEDASIEDTGHALRDEDSKPNVDIGLIDESDLEQMQVIRKIVSDAMCRDQRLLNSDLDVPDTVMHVQFELQRTSLIRTKDPANVAIITDVIRELADANHREKMFRAYKRNVELALDPREQSVTSFS